MKILYLPLKAKWYEMIERGEKREEYRECSVYWIRRLMEYDGKTYDIDNPNVAYDNYRTRRFDAVCFSYGYTKRRMLWECKGITIGQGRPEWGAPAHGTFIIKLGKRL